MLELMAALFSKTMTDSSQEIILKRQRIPRLFTLKRGRPPMAMNGK